MRESHLGSFFNARRGIKEVEEFLLTMPDETKRWHGKGTNKGGREERQAKASGRADTRFSCCRFKPEVGQ